MVLLERRIVYEKVICEKIRLMRGARSQRGSSVADGYGRSQKLYYADYR